ncbi:8-amino-7-oxononanoate synthase [Photobacterium leiognathi]|uniref:8-amino-7-oxononanoate synthase n=1 Tax=Photobacterium leiognathi TaxID=553611 RepID=UPI000D154253|nr:8-amino-7-oxononanoate synthase [Photobacterium leiognathi]PSW57757.1 8-amino-7-oxononanoate synthase [Photobacterium leiognathi subsp. mandapamensis]
MPHFSQRFRQALIERDKQGLYRSRTCLSRQQQAHQQQAAQVSVDQQSLINFSSNDYLGLAQSPELINAWQQGLSLYGAGSGASPLVTGFHSPHAKLEAQLSEWLGYDRALLFSSGFSANQALLFTLLQKQDMVFQDKLNHASLIEAGMLSPALMKRFAHNDVEALNTLLKKNTVGSEQANMVITEGVFSMDGDCSPLSKLRQACDTHHAWLVVDDAHGCGVLGEEGKGSCAAAGIKADILVITFGKAFGLQGAAILCDNDTAEYLIQFARHFIYSTAMPPAQAHALSKACELIQQQEWRREKLHDLSELLSDKLDPAIPLQQTSTPIKPIVIGESERTVVISEQLKQRGLWVGAIRPPTVPKNTARLRVTLTATHNEQDIRLLAASLNEVINEQYNG